MAVLVEAADRIYAVARGTGYLWLRVPSGPAHDDALGGGARAVEGLAAWVEVDGWQIDLGAWIRTSAELTRTMVTDDA
ncbi:MAG: hypothetical protein WEE50_06140 [Chloroflexota bacterium]